MKKDKSGHTKKCPKCGGTMYKVGSLGISWKCVDCNNKG